MRRKNLLGKTLSIGRCNGRQMSGAGFLLALVVGFALLAGSAKAQTAGDGAITGTVKDTSGAIIPNATVTAHNVATGVDTSRVTSSAGVYQISPLIVGTYSVTVAVPGFAKYTQENVTINENQIFGLNPVLKVGSQSDMVTVTEAPPQLNTANATLGDTISSSEFAALPLLVAGNQQRDITSFSNLLPGAQPGSRSSLFSGTANRLNEVYLDGIPLTTINMTGDNRPIFNIVPFEGIDQVGALTSGQSVEYQGAGSVNYSMKTGTNQYHGTVADFVRNTIFDTWGFTAINATQKKLVNGVITTVPVGKPVDHQNELAASFGGPVRIPHFFNGHDKLFFYAAYDKAHARSAPTYTTASGPTTLMKTGDFTEAGFNIFDPTTATCTGNSCTRKQFMGVKNGLPTPNIIPASEISPITQKMQSFLPEPSVSGIQNNYFGGTPNGFDNWLYSVRGDYTISPKQTLSGTVAGGNRHAVPYTSVTATGVVLPLPYTATTFSTVAGHWADLSDSYTITPSIVNQFKFGFSNFGGPPVGNITQNTQFAATQMGINFSGVPADGQAVTEFPVSIFGGSNAQTEWASQSGLVNTTATSVSNTFTAVDNLFWSKGRHNLTFGIQVQWLQFQSSTADGPTGGLTLNWGTNETAQESGSSYTTNTGYSYASYLLGAVGSTSLTLQPFSVLGGRYRPIAPYVEDDFKVNSKLTLNLGLRWDYIPSYTEVQNRYSFLNPNIKNPVTGNLGALEFAGSNGGPGVSCGCKTPVNTYWKNWGPRVGFAYSIDDKTVVRGAFSTMYSHGGGTGGAGGAGTGPSQQGFTSSPSFPDGAAGPAAGPAFYLNNSAAFTTLGLANSNFGGPGYSVPAITAPGAVSQTLNMGNTVNSSGGFITAGGAPAFPDFYLSGRAPEFSFWNFGIQRQILKDTTLTANYAGSESHFIAGASNMRGLQSGQINPIYWALGSLLTAPATPANLTAANAIASAKNLPAISLPYPGYGQAAATSTGAGQATIGHMLTWMPQFSGTTDIWGSQSANANYHSVQISLARRMSHGLTLNLNYTYSKNLDDAGTMRSGWAIPGNLLLSGQSWKVNRIDRSLSANSVPQDLSIYGVYNLPFGKGGIGNDSWVVRNLAGGWTFSSVFTYISGTPLLITNSNCTSSFQPGAGTCMPDLNPNFTAKTIRQNGSWGKGMTAAKLGATPAAGGISYANGYIGNATNGDGGIQNGTPTPTAAPCGSSDTPFCNSGSFMFGDAPRVMPFDGLRNPSTYNMNASIRRSFNLTPERVKFIFAVDCQNVMNKVTFGGINASVGSTAFGTVSSATSNTGSRDFQFSGRLNF
ncbi:MAG TPA: carboxypeptidase regulatory-like domain-containing protein [Edaphobacter sp.]|nr:carboxypeptidase regulatory-like domain-containing protein [Edaphobacter sp.]